MFSCDYEKRALDNALLVPESLFIHFCPYNTDMEDEQQGEIRSRLHVLYGSHVYRQPGDLFTFAAIGQNRQIGVSFYSDNLLLDKEERAVFEINLRQMLGCVHQQAFFDRVYISMPEHWRITGMNHISTLIAGIIEDHLRVAFMVPVSVFFMQ